MNQYIRIIAAILLISSGIHAQTQPNRSAISIEADPAPFILGGYSVSLKFSPRTIRHFTVMGSVYSSALPDNMIGKSNSDKGFRDLKIETSYALFTDYFISSKRTGFHAGPSVFFYSKSVGNNLEAGRQSFRSIYPNLRIGYLYKPFKKSGLYLDPWFNIGKELVTNRNNVPQGEIFISDKFSYILAIHVGYQFLF